MPELTGSDIHVKHVTIRSEYLRRDVKVDFFIPGTAMETFQPALLFINDGQNMEELGLRPMLSGLYKENTILPVICVAIHAGEQRKREYGIASRPDYMGRGDLAPAYTHFIITELIPEVERMFKGLNFQKTGYAGFSLGAVSALDMVWNHSKFFQIAAVFSGSLWWRSVAQEDPAYSDDKHRIMHQEIRNGHFQPGLRFYLQCGNMDETKDRNQNGIIDSIEDTIDLMKELEAKGYHLGKDIHYREMVDGKHDIETWGRAFPEFLQWAFGK